jgi:shikimate kinase
MANVFLIGYMGAGKSTVGKRLAHRLGASFVDTDRFIENRYRKKIADLFADWGEAYFRGIECAVLEEVASFENAVIATGGGTPCFFDNMERMNRTGITVYLKVSVAELLRRLSSGRQQRPLVAGKSAAELEAFVCESLARREEWYNRASIVFPAEEVWPLPALHATIDALVQRIDEQVAATAGRRTEES